MISLMLLASFTLAVSSSPLPCRYNDDSSEEWHSLINAPWLPKFPVLENSKSSEEDWRGKREFVNDFSHPIPELVSGKDSPILKFQNDVGLHWEVKPSLQDSSPEKLSTESSDTERTDLISSEDITENSSSKEAEDAVSVAIQLDYIFPFLFPNDDDTRKTSEENPLFNGFSHPIPQIFSGKDSSIFEFQNDVGLHWQVKPSQSLQDSSPEKLTTESSDNGRKDLISSEDITENKSSKETEDAVSVAIQLDYIFPFLFPNDDDIRKTSVENPWQEFSLYSEDEQPFNLPYDGYVVVDVK